eukprot:249943_1
MFVLVVLVELKLLLYPKCINVKLMEAQLNFMIILVVLIVVVHQHYELISTQYLIQFNIQIVIHLIEDGTAHRSQECPFDTGKDYSVDQNAQDYATWHVKLILEGCQSFGSTSTLLKCDSSSGILQMNFGNDKCDFDPNNNGGNTDNKTLNGGVVECNLDPANLGLGTGRSVYCSDEIITTVSPTTTDAITTKTDTTKTDTTASRTTQVDTTQADTTQSTGTDTTQLTGTGSTASATTTSETSDTIIGSNDDTST